MFFVLAQHRELGRTFERNVRMGGYKSEKSACAAAVKRGDCVIRDHNRKMVACTFKGELQRV